ncbi:hypothetical protein CsSME_00008131 [Camellia sinensis var. sinensis]
MVNQQDLFALAVAYVKVVLCPLIYLSSVRKKLWHLRIPNKIKFFAWRASLNIIPTSDLLRRRHVSVAGNCVLCPNCPETLLHCVRDCHVAKRVARNQAVFNEVVRSAEDIVLWVCELLHDFSLANHRSISAPVFEDPVRWVAPIDGFYKVNFDGAVFNHLKAVGVGRIDCWGDANCAEAFAAQRAVHFAMDLGILDVHLEGDSLNIIRALQAADPLLCSYGHVLQDAIAKGRCFRKWNVSHTPRLGNRVAHSLAQLALKSSGPSIWMEEVPFVVFPLVLSEAL